MEVVLGGTEGCKACVTGENGKVCLVGGRYMIQGKGRDVCVASRKGDKGSARKGRKGSEA